MLLCFCNICLLTRSRVSIALTAEGKAWWLHWEEINEVARRECEKARANGYVDPPAPLAPGVLLN